MEDLDDLLGVGPAGGGTDRQPDGSDSGGDEGDAESNVEDAEGGEDGNDDGDGDGNGNFKQNPNTADEGRKRLGDVIKELLEAPVAEGACPILSAPRGKNIEKRIRQERKQAVELKKKRKIKRLLTDKEHVLPQFDHIERRLLQIATKGVVTLFNTIAKAQRDATAAEFETIEARESKNFENVSKTSFLDMIKKGAKRGEDGAKEDNTENTKSQWSVFDDKHMMAGTRVKDWNIAEEEEQNEDAEDIEENNDKSEESEDVSDDNADPEEDEPEDIELDKADKAALEDRDSDNDENDSSIEGKGENTKGKISSHSGGMDEFMSGLADPDDENFSDGEDLDEEEDIDDEEEDDE